MKAEDWMISEVQTCSPEASLNEAAHLMWKHDIGVLPVVDAEDRVLGLVTDRDLCMGTHLAGRSPHQLSVGASMSRTLFACCASDSIEQVLRLMGNHQVRRLPVLDNQGRLVGILSMNDLVRGLISLQDARLRSTLEPRLVEALASISETRSALPSELIPERPVARREATPVASPLAGPVPSKGQPGLVSPPRSAV